MNEPEGWEQVNTAWEVIAVDGCPVCAPLHGRRFASIDELYEVLPGFGPVAGCPDDGGCGCRAVPTR